MVKFNAKTYKKTLFKSTTIQDCKKIPVLSGNEPYIFISYSHKDYKQVYADLADLHESGIRFWYDTDLLAGINWDDGVRKRLTDPKCRGIIFYLSDNSLRSEAILTEIRIAIGEDSATSCLPKNLDYFAVNLTSDLPSVLVNRIFDGTDNGNERKRILEKAFPDEQIFLIHEDGKNKKKNYWPKLIQNIMLRFNIYPENDPYKLRSSGAELISGHAVIHYSDGATYDGAFVNNRLHHHGTLRFPDGSVYDGNFHEGQRHGYGEMTFADGRKYSGDWKNGTRDGKCVMIWPNGMRYEGACSDDKISGHGTCILADGRIYTGDWQNNAPHGSGTMTHPDGFVYEGDWHAGNMHGKGIYRYGEGNIYDGEFSHGKPHGKGIFTVPGHSKYVGYWIDGKKHGKGICEYANGNKYIGNWLNDKRHGKGICKYANGDKYIGNWLNNKRHGKGICEYADGSVYDGEWLDDNQHGSGIMTYNVPSNYDELAELEELAEFLWSLFSSYDGEWYKNNRHGIGRGIYPNGDIYEGEWKDDIPMGNCTFYYKSSGEKYVGEWYQGANGYGTFYYPDGKSHSGTWFGGMFFEGSGLFRYGDGSEYNGEICKTMHHGQGVYTLADGTIQSGRFAEGEFLGNDE